MRRLAPAILFATVAVGISASAAQAAPTKYLSDDLGALWTRVLETPSPQNPFGSGGSNASTCWNLGAVVAPFGPSGAPACTVKTGTKIFVVARSGECSHWEVPAGQLPTVTCARNQEPGKATVTLDGKPLPLTKDVTTPNVKVTLPADNVFGVTSDLKGTFVAIGDVAEVHPLPPGKHTIVIKGDATITTIITVTRGGR
jgi:hypothetical protein